MHMKDTKGMVSIKTHDEAECFPALGKLAEHGKADVGRRVSMLVGKVVVVAGQELPAVRWVALPNLDFSRGKVGAADNRSAAPSPEDAPPGWTAF